MKLSEALDIAYGGTAKIGSNTGFIFADNVTRDTKSIIDDMAKESYKQRVKNLNSIAEKLSNYDAYWDEYEQKAIAKYLKQTENKKSLEEYREDLAKRKVQIQEKLQKAMEYETAYLGDWVPYSEREVKKVYKSCDEYAVIIIFDGDEAGKYWTCREYRREKVA